LLPILNPILYMHLAMDRAEVGNGISPGFFAFQAVARAWVSQWYLHRIPSIFWCMYACTFKTNSRYNCTSVW